MAVSDEVRVGVAGSHDRKRTQGDIKLVLAIIAILDLVAILVAEILAWDLRVGFDVWFDTPAGWAAGDQRRRSPGSRWGGWSRWRPRGRTPRATSVPDRTSTARWGSPPPITAAAVGSVCYLLQLPLSRGFIVFVFLVGLPLLLLERFVAAQGGAPDAQQRPAAAPGHRHRRPVGHQRGRRLAEPGSLHRLRGGRGLHPAGHRPRAGALRGPGARHRLRHPSDVQRGGRGHRAGGAGGLRLLRTRCAASPGTSRAPAST